MAKLNKATVIHKFKYEVLTDNRCSGLTEDDLESVWEVYLIGLAQMKKITAHQAQTWTYPVKEIKLT